MNVFLNTERDYEAGNTGENNAVELKVHIPEKMLNKEHIYRLVFSNGTITQMLTPVDGILYYFLQTNITAGEEVKMQLEEFDGIDLVRKSAVVTLHFSESVRSVEVPFTEDIISEVNANSMARHTHIDLGALNKITESEGVPLYDGKPFGGGASEEELKQLETRVDGIDEDISSLKESQESLSSDVEDISENLSQYKEEVSQSFNDVNETIESVNVKADTNDEHIQELSNNVGNYGQTENDIPTFLERPLKLGEFDVIPIPFNVRQELTVRKNRLEVSMNAGNPYTNHVYVETNRGSILVILNTKRIDVSSVGMREVRLYADRDYWVYADGTRAGAPYLADLEVREVVVGDEHATDLLEMSPNALAAYKSFCRLVNVSEDAMGDVLHDDEWNEAPMIDNGVYYPKINHEYMFSTNSSVTISFPEVEPTRRAYISFNIHKDGDEEIDIALVDENGENVRLYGGVATDFSGEGNYRLIAVKHPYAGWCASAEKMEEPS